MGRDPNPARCKAKAATPPLQANCRGPVVSCAMASETFDPKERAREKQLSREQDERDLASGAKTREQLRRENGFFAFPTAKILWDECERLS